LPQPVEVLAVFRVLEDRACRPFKSSWTQLSHVQMLVDHWLDHECLPAPYVWPPRAGS